MACRKYINRPATIHSILNDLFLLLRIDGCHNLEEILDFSVFAMKRFEISLRMNRQRFFCRHIERKDIQISGTAVLYYLFKSENLKEKLKGKANKKILSTLLHGMLAHNEDPALMRNGLTIICLLKMPDDFLVEYEKIVRHL